MPIIIDCLQLQSLAHWLGGLVLQPRVYNSNREGEYPTPYTAVQMHCGYLNLSS